MSDITFRKVRLCELFHNQRGNSKYTKKYCNHHLGEYEVYTGTTIGSFGKIFTYDYDTPNLTYTTDGVNAGTVELLHGKYNVGGHRAILTSIPENLYLEYFEYVLEPIFKNIVKKGNVPSVTWSSIKDIDVNVPIKSNGEYDIDVQKEIAGKFLVLKKKAKELDNYRSLLQESYTKISTDKYNYSEKPLNELFEYKRGRSCTKAFCNINKGVYPVWSANNNIPLAYVNFYDYDGTYISLSRNGIAGKITILEGKFTINEDRFLLVPKQNNIDFEYIKYILEPLLRQKTKGRAGHDGKNEFTKLSFSILDTVIISIPINKFGEYDLDAQKEIAKKYKIVDDVKNGISEKIDALVNTEVIMTQIP